MTDLQIVEEILNREGWNGPTFFQSGDRGGRTAWGISEKAHPDEWRNGPPSRERARAIYIAEYVTPWIWIHDDRLRALLVDWSVTSGHGNVTRGLQGAVKADVDGELGPETMRLTLAAINAGRPVLADVIRARAEFHMRTALDEPRMRQLLSVGQPMQAKWLRGWIRRTLEFVAIIAALLLPATAQAQERPSRVTGGLIAVGARLAMGESVFSESCIQQGTCREVNRLMPDGKGAGATAGRAALKAAGTTAMTVVLLKLRKKHPKIALVGSVGFVAFNGWLAANAFDHLRNGQR